MAMIADSKARHFSFTVVKSSNAVFTSEIKRRQERIALSGLSSALSSKQSGGCGYLILTLRLRLAPAVVC